MKRMMMVAALVALAMDAGAAKKLIFVGWDTGDLTPAEIVRNADALYKAGADGVGIYPRLAPVNGAPTKRASALDFDRKFTEADLEWMLPALREMSAKPGLSESMFRAGGAPAKRIGWRDDGRWAAFAANLATIASIARRGELKGIISDFEDYHSQSQYRWKPGEDPSYDETYALARRRGAEAFGAMFRAFPGMTWLTYQFISHETCYRDSLDPVGLMRDRGDLYPAFFNGILDAMPPGVKLVDGAEHYRLRAANADFLRQARYEFSGVLPLVAPENRAKYRAQLSVSFGQYPDSYAWHEKKSGWYFGPVNGSRLMHFEQNLAGALEACDEYIWLWGEHRTFVNWKGLDHRHWWDEWWGGEASLDDALPGYADVLWGLKDPIGYVKRRFAAGGTEDVLGKAKEWEWQSASTNILKGTFSKDEIAGRGVCHVLRGMGNGSVNFTLRGAKFGEWYGVKVSMKGTGGSVGIAWQKNGGWRYDKGGAKAAWDVPDADGWRTGWLLARVPEDINGFNLGLCAKQGAGDTLAFTDVRIVKLRDVPDGAKELRQVPKTKR
jgi:hypothetical protein